MHVKCDVCKRIFYTRILSNILEQTNEYNPIQKGAEIVIQCQCCKSPLIITFDVRSASILQKPFGRE